MNRRTRGSVASLIILGFAGCSSVDGTAKSVSAPPQDMSYSPQPQPSPNAEKTQTRPQLHTRDKNTPEKKLAQRSQTQKRTTIVVDVDDTLCVTDYNCVLWGIGSDDSRPLISAATTLRKLAEKYDILYLTARPAVTSHRTERWLRKYNFPEGPVLGSRNVIDFIGQTSFKKKTLAKLRQERGGTLIGIGDRPRDSEAYRTNQMLSVIVNPCRGGTFHPDDVIFRDWDAVARFFEANEDVLLDPLKLAENLRTGDLRIELPG